MAFDGIVLNSLTKELKNIIGYKIDKVYQPSKNTILLGLYSQGVSLSLLMCISPDNYRVHLTTHDQKNPMVAPNFCMLLRKHLIGLKIKNIYTFDLERILFIDLENKENPNKPIYKKIVIELMGKHSNIILTDETNIIIDSLRHISVEEHSTRDIYPTSKYILPESLKYSFMELTDFQDFYNKIEPRLTECISTQINNIDNLNISNFEIDKIISNTFNGISSAFIKNIITDLNLTSISKDALELIFNNINEYLHCNSFDIHIETQKNYNLFLTTQNLNKFQLNYAIDDFYFKKENEELFKNYRNSILNLILQTLKKYEKRLKNIDTKIEECNNMEKYRLYGELITANLYKIPNINIESIDLENYYNNNEIISIPLDKKYVPSFNAKRYFKKYSKLKNALEVVNIQKNDTIQDITYIESVIYEIEACKTIEELDEIYEEISENSIFINKLKYKSNKKNKKAKLMTKNKLSKFNPLKYTIDGYTILVGRNNKENDYLTCKYANKSDLWFHTKDIPGCHVILRTPPNEIIPESILIEAATIAVSHSKAKNSSHVPVDFCKVSFVKKPHGSKAGFVIYSNNQTLYV